MVSFVGAPQQHRGKMTPSDLGSKYASPPLNQVLPYPSMPPAPAALYPATTTYSSPSPYMGYSPNPASYPPPPHIPTPAGYPPQACFPAAYPPQAYPPAPQPSTYYPTGKLTLLAGYISGLQIEKENVTRMIHVLVRFVILKILDPESSPSSIPKFFIFINGSNVV